MKSPETPNPILSSDHILATMAEGVVLLDQQGEIRFWNPAMSRIAGFDEAEALGQSYRWLRCPEASRETVATMLEQNGQGDPDRKACLREWQCLLRGPHGEHIPVLVNVQPVHEGKRLMGILMTFTDFRSMEGLTRELSELERAQQRSPDAFHGIIGKDPAMQELYRLVELAADSDATVLLLGESGTGKELAAQAIHELSHRSEAPFVKVNCGALTETILESELFGHVKGAFTGAYRDRAGRFEAADKGTLLLDEIGEISPMLQVKLLRVLQEKTFERVGESSTRTSDVRVIAATNRDLAERVREGHFREDLYYRLRVFPVTMPPLRQRLDDVPLLVQHFIRRFRKSTGKPIENLDEEAMRSVMDYCWPGNVRELENAVEHAFVTCQTQTIGLFDLPQELRQFELRRSLCLDPPTHASFANRASASGTTVSERARREAVKDPRQLRRLLEECDWNKAEVGRRLGISRTAVWKWMKRHGIPLQP